MTIIEEVDVNATVKDDDGKVVDKARGQFQSNTSRAMRHKEEHHRQQEILLTKLGRAHPIIAKNSVQYAALQQAKLRLFFRQLCYPKKEPLDGYPVEKQNMVPYAMQYLFENFLTAALELEPDWRTQELTPLTKQYFKGLQDPMYFQTMIAFSLSMAHNFRVQTISPEDNKTFENAILSHGTKAYTLLRDRLAEEDLDAKDVTVQTIVTLAAVNLLNGDVEACRLHYQGVKRIVDARGGVDKLGWGGYIRARYLQLEGTLHSTEVAERTPPIMVERKRFEVPSHPFPADVCVAMSKFPHGFEELGLSRRLSYAMISFVGLGLERFQSNDDQNVLQFWPQAEEILKMSPSALERLLIVTFFEYAHWMDKVRKFSVTSHVTLDLRMQAQMALLNDFSLFEIENAYQADELWVASGVVFEAVVWCAQVLCAATASRTATHKWAMSQLSEMDTTKVDQTDLEADFLPLPVTS